HQQQYAQGLRAYEQGDFRQAASSFEVVLKSGRDSAQAAFAHGRACQQRGDYRATQEAYELAEQHLKKKDGHTQACLGYCMSRRNALKPALEYYNAALGLGFESAELQNNRGHH